jgi:hypothetical protein
MKGNQDMKYDGKDGSSHTAETTENRNHARARQRKEYSCLNRGALGNPDLAKRIGHLVHRQICEAIDENLKDVMFRAHLSHNITEQAMTQLRLADQWIGLDDANCSYEDVVQFLCGERFHNAIREDVASALWAATRSRLVSTLDPNQTFS